MVTRTLSYTAATLMGLILGQIRIPVPVYPLRPGTPVVQSHATLPTKQDRPTKPLWTPGTSCWNVREQCETVSWFYLWSRYSAGPGQSIKITGPRGDYPFNINSLPVHPGLDMDKDGDVDHKDWHLRLNALQEDEER